MGKVKCLSVRLESLISISDKAYKATCFDGSSDILPKSCVYGEDYDVQKSEAYWIASWILEKKNLQYSQKKIGWYDTEKRKILPNIKIETHIPEKKEYEKTNPNEELIR